MFQRRNIGGMQRLIAFCLIMFSPLILLFFDSSALQSPIRRAALKGLILYMLMAAVDGGYNFIPTQTFYLVRVHDLSFSAGPHSSKSAKLQYPRKASPRRLRQCKPERSRWSKLLKQRTRTC